MDDTLEMQKGGRHKDLDAIMERLQHHTSDEGAVSFHKSPDNENAVDHAANEVFDGLMYVLEVVGEDAVEAAKGEGRKAKDYETVLRTMEPMANVCRGLADDKIPLRRNVNSEQLQAQEGDTITAYEARSFNLDGSPFDRVSVMIRPKMYIRPTNTPRRRPDQDVSEQRQARMRISIKPKDVRVGEITIRVDQEDLRKDMKISYDVIVGDQDLLTDLDTTYDGQAGHHFSSEKRAKDFGCSFEDILKSYDKKFAQVAANQGTTLETIAHQTPAQT